MEDYDRMKALLKGSDMIFITAGRGGGTGTAPRRSSRAYRGKSGSDGRHRHQAIRL